MQRISTSVSLCFTLLAIGGAVGGCSSDSTDEGGKGGSGSGSSAGSGSGATGGSNASGGSGGSAANNGGSASGTGGGRAGSTGVGGTAPGSCTPGVVTCVDATTAAICDEDTGETITVDCVNDLPEIGLSSTGCQGDATKGNCNGEPTDAACWDGASVFALCGSFTPDQIANIYINCFQDTGALREQVTCTAPYLAASGQEADCDAAAAECLPDASAGGAGGAGG